MRHFVSIIIILSLSSYAFALNIEDRLENPELEKRAIEVFSGIRCVVCAGESIADSRSDLAKDMRAVVRSKIKENYTNNQALNYIVERYGDEVLMRPPFNKNTYLLWFAPFIILIFGVMGIFFVIKRKYTACDSK